ncbi:DNA-binding protein [Treponema primitia ZAS-2]|uniref:DNA-binding protein n=1 Tax=Treponema primitia (strain ATCC BAA-887 / DSM 12427 / ZAS-2) TaxID=545694 RepID=F5YK63_TREPZ|nr:helix-turn-helix transcriptional regulator [Treponema primitia]AEF85782.1 DNA-binding protein [Treponema primitia ZAS-2]
MNERDLRSILSLNIKKYRNYRKLSQAEFAEKIGISIPFLSDIENGKKWLSPRTLAKIASALNIEAYELLKPEKLIPDNIVDILEKYKVDINEAFGKTLGDLHENFISQVITK